jgi:puromycin-sensitive aminopeptidase
MRNITEKKPSVRLPKHVVPVRYSILLYPDLEVHTFTGEETISLKLEKNVREITLHCLELVITSAKILFGREMLEADAISYDEKAETATFYFSKSIPKGNAKLMLAWTGILNDNMRGFYKSRYTVEGSERFMATTQFEATDARRCIPSFDEPAQKAVFDVSLVVGEGKTAISNTMPVATREHSAGFNVVSFAPTPKMSTYLLAFIVGDFEYLEATTKRGVKVRVYTIPGKKEQGRFALECGVKTLDLYEEYFAINYPLPVLDMIAIPDFAAGAMENWGAVTYRETILIDETATSLAIRQWVAIVVAHELAHQWFGNLVTMEWWTDLWLNEGFASYVEYLAVDKLFPEWNMWSQFLLQDHGPALRLDALLHTHPIEVEVHDPSEIGEIFDEVSYSKGASVIRMLAEYIGPKNFRDGLRHYLKAHSYKNTRTLDLWESFEKVSKLPVKKMMQNWTQAPGYPLVRVATKGKKLVLSQERFFASPLSEKKAKSAQSWMVPVSIESAEGTVMPFLMNKPCMEISRTSDSWIKLNAKESGLFRASYDKELLGLLAEPIASKTLSPLDRFGIIRDLFALVEAGKQDATAALSMLKAYENEDEYIVWGEILSSTGKIARVFGDAAYGKDLKTFMLSVLSKKAEAIGWEKVTGETPETAFLRSGLLYAVGHYGHKETIAKAKALFKNREASPIAADLRGVVYSLVAECGGEAEWNALKEMYVETTFPEEKNRIGRALTHTTSKKLLGKTLAFSLSKDVRSQDAPTMIASVLSNSDGTMLAWEFIQKNWKKLCDRYSSGGHMLPRLLSPLAFFLDKAVSIEIKKFFKKNPAPGAVRTLLQVEEKILGNDAWKKRDGKLLEKWLGKDR